MNRQAEREEILHSLLTDFGNELTENELVSITANSNCYGWVCDDVQNLFTWNEGKNIIGFTVDLGFSGEQDENRYSYFDSVSAKVEGIAKREGNKWVISDYNIIKAEENYHFEDDKSHINAIVSNVDYYQTFTDEIESLKVLNNIEVSDPKPQLILRKQIFTGIITCLETYLSDAFINKVLSDFEFLDSFFSNFDFNGKTIKMSELPEYADKVETVAKEAMLEVLYHNLPKVSKIYEEVLKIKFPSFTKLAKAVSTRHDLVHRNGKTKKGVKVIITKQKIEELITDVESFVSELNEKVKNKLNIHSNEIGLDDDIPF